MSTSLTVARQLLSGVGAANTHVQRLASMAAFSVARRSISRSSRGLSSSGAARPPTSALKTRLQQIIPAKVAEVKEIQKRYGAEKIDTVTIEQTMVWETSLLDPEEGIRFRGKTIPEVQAALPKAPGGSEPLPEALWWLLLTGEVPTPDQAAEVAAEWHARSRLPEGVPELLAGLPKTMHPMTQLSMGLLALQPHSAFARRYSEGMKKGEYWDATYEDAMTILAQMPQVAAHIFRNQYHGGSLVPLDPKLDWAANFAHMLGFESAEFRDLMRLYLTIHADHEGGNVSAHTVHLGLAGPLHGLANQEVLAHLHAVQKQLAGQEPTAERLEALCWEQLRAGRVIPGYGHAVLRRTDPRYKCLREFALRHLPHDPLFKLCSAMYEVVPRVLMEQGKVKNPWPNVDAHSGVNLVHYGLTQQNYFTVLFGLSRAVGTLAQLVWDHALGFPLERPKSVTTEWVKAWLFMHGKPLGDREEAARAPKQEAAAGAGAAAAAL